MRSLSLDYRRNNRWPQRLGWSGLLLVCLAMGGYGWQYRQLALDIEAGKVELARFARQGQPTGFTDSRAGKLLQAEMSQARDVLQQLDVPWDRLFEAVETSTTPEVALLGIEPEPKQETVRIIGEAKTYQTVLAYTRRLEESTPLDGVHLQSHQIQTRDPEHPVHFVLGAAWRRQP